MGKSIKTGYPLITCPHCGKAEIPLPAVAREITCPLCAEKFSAKNGFINLLIKYPDNVPPIDASMEWKWLINIYESPLWRKNLLLNSITGISFKKEKQKIFDALALKGNEIILDLACGPGIYTRAFAEKTQAGRVFGFDLSEPMLNYAVNKAKQQNLENILFLRGNAMDLPFAENSFDVVNCCGALHLFPEIEKVLNRIYRILKPGGKFTGAAAYCPEGKFIKKIVSYSQKKSGLTYYTDQRMQTLLQNCGFAQKTFLHKKHFWMIIYAEK